jgi:hypothetical protein
LVAVAELGQAIQVLARRIWPSNDDDSDALAGSEWEAPDRTEHAIIELGFDDCHAGEDSTGRRRSTSDCRDLPWKAAGLELHGLHHTGMA